MTAIRLVHPFPSLVNSALVFGLAALAGGSLTRAPLLAFGMLGMQFCIGAVNDLHDQPVDRLAKPWKPLAAGIVSRRTATIVALATGGGGFVLAALAGPVPTVTWLAMLGCGLAYDLFLKPTLWAWLCFAVAFTLMPVYAWLGAAGVLPPRAEFLLPLAFLAGPLIALSNGLSDLERDEAAGLRTLATRLGRRNTLAVMLGLLLAIHGLAWLLLAGVSVVALAPVAAASGLALVGLVLSAQPQPQRREVGWMIQAVALALLGLAWLAALR
ncbi:MAG: UbiA family prenyltransferase [Chloroflexota bacterium]